MKELSVEEKAKAYDEAIERANDILKGYDPKEEPKATINYIFPELKESEDEEIRKGLIKAFGSIGKKEWGGVNVKNAIVWLEKQGEPTEKAEPKFKVGDWITFYGGNPFKILNIEREENGILDYLLLSQDGYDSFYDKKYVDKNARLWTIQDAKAGDVLADDYGIYIFDRFDEHDERCFLCMGVYQYSQKVFENEHMLCSVEVHPATKKQCDLLFQKMKDSGYEWDAKNKELNKIHIIDEGKAEMDYCFTKMMNGEKVTPAWSEKDRTMAFTLMRDVDQMSYISKEGKNERIGWLNSLDEKFASTESAWSEEDDMMLECVLDKIGDLGTGVMCKGWLKSLKNRIKGE